MRHGGRRPPMGGAGAANYARALSRRRGNTREQCRQQEGTMASKDLLGLEGKNALVAGGGSGIGRATALLLGDAGANVVVADLDKERASAVQAEVEAKGVRASAV